MPNRRGVLAGLLWGGCACGASAAEPVDVALGGFAYAGEAATLDRRFPFSRQFERQRTESGRPLHRQILDDAARLPGAVRLVPGIDELKGRDRALAVALVVGAETSSVERIGKAWKLLSVVRGQVLFFDFKSMAVVRAYPISFGNPEALDHEPGPDERLAGMARVYEGTGGKPGLLERFALALQAATLPAQAPRLLQVTESTLESDAVTVLPQALGAEPITAQTWLADLVGEAISTRAQVPIVPFAKGYAIGNVMSLRVADGSVFQLRLPTPDYEIRVHLARFKRVTFGQSAAGTALVYGSWARVKVVEPLLNKVFLEAEFKNGESKRVPANQDAVDDFPAFYDSLNGLFVKLARAIDGQEREWVQAATTAPDIQRQLAATKELVRLCR